MKKIIVSCIVFLFLSILPASAQSPGQVDMYLFYGQGCSHCGRIQDFLEEIQEKYPKLNIIEHEVYFDDENRQLFEEMSAAFGNQIQGVPTVFIDERMIVGFSNSIAMTLEQEIERCIRQDCGSPLKKLENPEEISEVVKIVGESSPTEDPAKTKVVRNLTIPAVFSAAAVDAINPCAFAVLIILLTTILASRSRRKALFSGLAFTSSIFISYLLMGIGLYSAIQISGMTHIFFAIVATLAILIGLFNLKDYLWYGKWFVMEVPMSWRPKLKTILQGVTSAPGAFLIGFVVSLFLLPCTSGPYIVILGLLAETTTRNTAFVYLLLYNFVFILPMLIITFAIYFGLTTTEKAEKWRTKQLKNLHLIAGIIILLLGIGMIVAMSLGLI